MESNSTSQETESFHFNNPLSISISNNMTNIDEDSSIPSCPTSPLSSKSTTVNVHLTKSVIRSPVIRLKSPVIHTQHLVYKGNISRVNTQLANDSPSLVVSKTATARTPLLLIRSPELYLDDTLDCMSNRNYSEMYDDEIVEEVVDIIKAEERKKFWTGFFYLFMVVICWVFAVQLTNNVMKGSDYNHPIFCAYVNGCFFMMFGIKSFFKFIVRYWKKFRTIISTRVTDDDHSSFHDEDSSYDDAIILNTPNIRLSSKQIFIVAMQAASLYFFSCCLSTSSLKFTSASNQTILATTSSVFTLIIGAFCKVEKITLLKVISIIASIGGILLITLGNFKPTSGMDSFILESAVAVISDAELGDLMALLGACLYSGYLILLRLKLGEQTNDTDDSIVYGLIGVNTTLFLFPFLVIAHLLGLEPLTMPESKTILLIILISGLLNAISDYCAAVASLLTSPLLTSLSLSTAIPISMICDSIFYNDVNTSAWYYLGIILIFSSFVFTSLESEERTMNTAVQDALGEAIENDEILSPILSPYLSGMNVSMFTNSSSNGVEGHTNEPTSKSLGVTTSPIEATEEFMIGEPLNGIRTNHNFLANSQVVVSGGKNHKYFIREIGSLAESIGSLPQLEPNNSV
ncbi:unnamed protein product [Ambrosiozyma monospora]|uniref:Unnamed protein product n=1 Tax=Ambrosiozyma monospora TaxID=43982 RepID=A0A9W7DGG5_AMBMO|nr:unnamed protein product [Ambrosiozyma monospora]